MAMDVPQPVMAKVAFAFRLFDVIRKTPASCKAIEPNQFKPSSHQDEGGAGVLESGFIPLVG
jgi:hypothetical protein